MTAPPAQACSPSTSTPTRYSASDKNLQDLAVFANVGTGPLKITGGPDEAEGGLMSYLEGGVAYERSAALAHRHWGRARPLIHMWSQSATLTGALVGVRLAFYSGP